MATSAQQIRDWQGPAILGYGFRPFFLSAAAFAAFAMLVWIGTLTGLWSVPSAYGPIEWHAHEFLWGYLPAVIAGFLLTAVPNWTGRLPIVGVPLAVLWAFWAAGRIAMYFSASLTLPVAAAIDLTFLAALAFVIAREILAGQNWRNLKVLVMVAILIAGNIVFHLEAASGGAAASGYGIRIGVAAAIMLIAVIGGRIIPSFTRNWLVKRGPGRLPAQFDRVDQVVLGLTALALVAWTAAPQALVSGLLCCLAGLANFYRLWRWAGWRTFAEPLVSVLHAGYVFVPLGFIAVGAAAHFPGLVPRPAAQHVWMAGAIALMTLAVMTRASLGHSGQPLTAGKRTSAIYLLAIVAVLARFVSGIFPGVPGLLDLAGGAWILSFVTFVVVYAPLLVLRRTA